MGIDLKGNFKKLKDAANLFVQASGDWRQQVVVDKTPLNPDDQQLLADLDQLEQDFTTWTRRSDPTDISTLRSLFIDADTLLTKAKDIYSPLSGISQTPEAQTKEADARKSLKQLIKVMNEVRKQLFPKSLHATDNLFLDIMEPLIGSGPVKIGTNEFPEVRRKDFNLTRELFEGKTRTLDDDSLKHLTDSWTTVVASFVQSILTAGASSPPVDMKADFFIMHSLLEELYDFIVTDVKRKSVVAAGSVGP